MSEMMSIYDRSDKIALAEKSTELYYEYHKKSFDNEKIANKCKENKLKKSLEISKMNYIKE
jgi:hypothetical protein